MPVILIPWMVIQELDYLKDSNKDFSAKKSAFTAIKYINELLGQSHPRLIGKFVTLVNFKLYVWILVFRSNYF